MTTASNCLWRNGYIELAVISRPSKRFRGRISTGNRNRRQTAGMPLATALKKLRGNRPGRNFSLVSENLDRTRPDCLPQANDRELSEHCVNEGGRDNDRRDEPAVHPSVACFRGSVITSRAARCGSLLLPHLPPSRQIGTAQVRN